MLSCAHLPEEKTEAQGGQRTRGHTPSKWRHGDCLLTLYPAVCMLPGVARLWWGPAGAPFMSALENLAVTVTAAWGLAGTAALLEERLGVAQRPQVGDSVAPFSSSHLGHRSQRCCHF